MKEQIWEQIVAVRRNSPLVHNITNYVVMNNTANALLAAGASPVMAHAHPEVEAMVSIAGAVVINIGTLDEYWVKSMEMAAKYAFSTGKPWVLDPVGAGATPYRDEVLKQLMQWKPTVIKGNASEIIALTNRNNIPNKGVDSTHDSDDAISAARLLNEQTGSVVCISGATDIIVDGERLVRLFNGHSMMGKITGMGCTAAALIGAFMAVDSDRFRATASAMALLGVAGQLAAERSSGPGSLQMNLLDTLCQMSSENFYSVLEIDDEDAE